MFLMSSGHITVVVIQVNQGNSEVVSSYVSFLVLFLVVNLVVVGYSSVDGFFGTECGYVDTYRCYNLGMMAVWVMILSF